MVKTTDAARQAFANLTSAPLTEPALLRGRGAAAPAARGLYGVWCNAPPPIVPVDDCVARNDWRLLYLGISPGRPASRQSLRARLRHHVGGNAEGSTLRRTLGVLLSDALSVELRRVGSGGRITLTHAGEQALDAWMDQHLRVSWTVCAAPWEVEGGILRLASFPLNLDDNGHHAFSATLSALRRSAITRARDLPIASEGNQSRRTSSPRSDG